MSWDRNALLHLRTVFEKVFNIIEVFILQLLYLSGILKVQFQYLMSIVKISLIIFWDSIAKSGQFINFLVS